MNYLCKYVKSGVYFVISNVTKDYTKYINSQIVINTGGESFKVIQEIEIR